MRAILFGSIGSVIETSEIQREAYNIAFERHGLDWVWDRDTYRGLLATSGGKARIEAYAERMGEPVGAAEIHRTKTDVFLTMLEAEILPLRDGVAEVLDAARETGARTGLVTTTERSVAEEVAAALAAEVPPAVDVLTHRGLGLPDKPNPAAYLHALEALGVAPEDALAIEDNTDGVTAARAAGLHVVAFPGQNTRAEDVAHADAVAEADGLPAAISPHLGAARPAAE
ncbi:MAG: HAD-IA family hydrolase [Paracoccaceae bacterium]|jgi:HAD superfamily hydrolase (TIGR01509 family)|nr:HAD-IA family hydrolase [Paracoccaceae bacterium]